MLSCLFFFVSIYEHLAPNQFSCMLNVEICYCHSLLLVSMFVCYSCCFVVVIVIDVIFVVVIVSVVFCRRHTGLYWTWRRRWMKQPG